MYTDDHLILKQTETWQNHKICYMWKVLLDGELTAYEHIVHKVLITLINSKLAEFLAIVLYCLARLAVAYALRHVAGYENKNTWRLQKNCGYGVRRILLTFQIIY